MTRVRASMVIEAPRRVVWRELADIPSHVRWMADAERIDFLSARTAGVGTCFDCYTRVGPIRLTDRMEIVEWKPLRSMGVRHVGVVTGEGRFSLRRARGGHTRVVWSEQLRFPWWLGGPVGGVVGGRVLAAIWRGNLRRLAARVELASGRR